jgi:hypothetical protein
MLFTLDCCALQQARGRREAISPPEAGRLTTTSGAVTGQERPQKGIPRYDHMRHQGFA